MEEKELKEALESIKAVKEVLNRVSPYMEGLWKMFVGIGTSVWFCYVLFQIILNRHLLRLLGLPWILLIILILAMMFAPLVGAFASGKKKVRFKLAFGNQQTVITFFALCVAAFVQALPQRINPISPDKMYAVWIIAYSFILFSTGKYFSLPEFTASGIAILAGIPISAMFPHFQYAISGAFLGLSLIIPSLIEIAKGSKNERESV